LILISSHTYSKIETDYKKIKFSKYCNSYIKKFKDSNCFNFSDIKTSKLSKLILKNYDLKIKENDFENHKNFDNFVSKIIEKNIYFKIIDTDSWEFLKGFFKK
jgi:hypothetical protein